METKEQAMLRVSLVKNLLHRLNQISGLPVRLRDAGVAEDMLQAIALGAINDGSLAFNPTEMIYDEALEVLKKAY